MGKRVAHNLMAGNILDFIELSPDYSMVEIQPPQEWNGKTLAQLDLRKRLGITSLPSAAMATSTRRPCRARCSPPRTACWSWPGTTSSKNWGRRDTARAPEGVRMPKCLLFSDGDGRLLALRRPLEEHGILAVPDPVDAELSCAREAGHGLFLVGAGEGCLQALFLAERYPVEALVLIGCPLRPRAASALRAA